MNWIYNRQIKGVSFIELCLMLVAISMPFNNNWNSYAVVLFGLAAFFSNTLQEKLILLKKHKTLWILPVGYICWIACSLLWDSGKIHSIFTIETYASFIAFPVLLGSMPVLGKGAIKKVMLAFVLSNIAGSVYCLIQAYLEYKATDYANFFYYHHLSKHIGINAISFSMYCLFSILVLLFYFLFNKYSNRWLQFIAFTAVAYLVVFVILLSSKMFIFLLYMIVVSITVYSYYYFSKVRLGAVIMFISLIIIPVLLLQFPYVYSRIEVTKVQEYRGEIDDQNGLAVRGVLWKSSWNLIKQKPVLGWGRYGASDALRKQYSIAGFTEGVTKNYDSHNQYLYTWVCYGLAGLLLLLFFFGKVLLAMFSKKHFLGIYLVFVFLLANVTESMLEVQNGIVFFLCFSYLFIFHSYSHQRSKMT